jgi:hypothetical protein
VPAAATRRLTATDAGWDACVVAKKSSFQRRSPRLTLPGPDLGGRASAVSSEYPRQHEGMCRSVLRQRRAFRHLRKPVASLATPGVVSDRSADLLCREPRCPVSRDAVVIEVLAEWGLRPASKHGRRRRRRERSRHERRGQTRASPQPSCRGPADECMARMMRKSNRARSTSDAALLLLQTSGYCFATVAVVASICAA